MKLTAGEKVLWAAVFAAQLEKERKDVYALIRTPSYLPIDETFDEAFMDLQRQMLKDIEVRIATLAARSAMDVIKELRNALAKLHPEASELRETIASMLDVDPNTGSPYR